MRRRDRLHADSLANTARLEMELGVGSWQDTIRQMREVLDQAQAERVKHRSAEDALLEQMRRQLGHLERVIRRREDEYDALQERFCAMQEQIASQ